jgi:hypothetical protein
MTENCLQHREKAMKAPIQAMIVDYPFKKGVSPKPMILDLSHILSRRRILLNNLKRLPVGYYLQVAEEFRVVA